MLVPGSKIMKRRRVMRLLAEIPAEHEAIAHHLADLAEAYQFEKIAEMLADG